MNKAILVGHLGQNPELKYTQGGTAVMKLRLATSDKRKGKDGEWQEQTEWHSVVLWGKRAEALSKFLKKGACLAVDGRMQTRSWEDKGGGPKRYATEVNADDVQLIGGKKKGGDSEDYEPGDAGEPSMSRPQTTGGLDDTDDVPF